MIHIVRYYDDNTIALQVVGEFFTEDMQIFANAFADKTSLGYSQVNILMTLEPLDLKNSSLLASWQERVWGVKNLKQMGKFAIVGNNRRCNWLKKAVNLEAWALMKLNYKADERYFDISEMDNVWDFIERIT